MLHPAPRVHDMSEPAGRQHHQRTTSERLPVVMSRAEWFWVVLLWVGVTAFMLVAIWLNIGTR